MRILLLSQFFSPSRGGGEYIFRLIAKTLAEHDHKVWVITNRISNEQYHTHKNIELIFVPPDIEYKGALPSTFSDNMRYVINALKVGMKIIKKEKIDIIHSNNFSPILAGSILAFFTSKPHVFTIHDIFSLCGKNYWKLWGQQSGISRSSVFLGQIFEKLMIKLRYNCIHAVSNATQNDLLQLGVKKPIYVIPNSVDAQPNPTSVKVNPYQFIYVGRLVFYKNLEVVIKAVDLVRKKEPKIKLIIAGSGPHQKTLEQLSKKMQLESNIEFKGHVTENEKVELISSSCAMVFPSLCEGFGLVILESFAQNKPVLVSDLKPMSEIVSHEKSGYIINPHDEKQWAKFLLEVIKNQEKTIIMGKNGAQILVSNYNQDIFYQNLEKMYREII